MVQRVFERRVACKNINIPCHIWWFLVPYLRFGTEFTRNATLFALKRLSKWNTAHTPWGMHLTAPSFCMENHWIAQGSCILMTWVVTCENVNIPCHISWFLNAPFRVSIEFQRNVTFFALKRLSKWHPTRPLWGMHLGNVSETIGLRKGFAIRQTVGGNEKHT